MGKIVKKTGAFILAAALMSTSVLAADAAVKFGETEVSFSESEPVIENGSVIISLNDMLGLLEQLGYEMTAVNRSDGNLTLKNEGRTIEINYDEDFIINGTTIPCYEQEDNLFMPLRAVCEAAGITVEWDGDTKTVLLSLGEAPEETVTLQIPSEDEEALKAAAEGMKRIYSVMALQDIYNSHMDFFGPDKEATDSLPDMAESYIEVLNSLDLPEQDKALAEKLEAFIYAANDYCQAEYEYGLSDDKEITEKYYDIYNKKQEVAEDFNTTAQELLNNYLTEELTSKYYCFGNSEEETEAAVSYYEGISDFMGAKLMKYFYPSSDEEENFTTDKFKEDIASVVSMLKESEPSESFLLLKYFLLGTFDLFSEYFDCIQNPEFDVDDPLNFYNIKAECCMYAESQFYDKMNYDLGMFDR